MEAQATANRSGTNPFLEMNHEADRGAGHSLHGLDLGDDQLLERINVIASNANNRVISAGNGGGGGNAWNLSQLLDNLGLPPHVNHDQYVGVAQRLSRPLYPASTVLALNRCDLHLRRLAVIGGGIV